MAIRIALLGERSVADDATGAIRTRSARTLALIAHLVVHAGMALPRQQVAGLFWPDSTEGQASTNLRREVHTLRRLLPGVSCLVVTPGELRWQDVSGVDVDLRCFAIERDAALAAARSGDTRSAARHADAALGTYAGELLPGLYDDWVLDDRGRLQRECADLCALVCRSRIALGEPALALQAARRRIQLEPLEETGYQALMELQSELGDRAGAIGTYHRCASLLEIELGVGPGPQTRMTLRRLLGQGQPAPGSQPSGPAAGPPTARAGVARASLVGREREVAALASAWRSATAGRAGVVVVVGSPGVGKTRLVDDLAAWAGARGAAVASAQCFGASARPALAPVAEWLRAPDLRSAATGLDPVWREKVERLVPSGTSRLPAPARSGGGIGDAWQRHRFFEGLARAVLGAGRPVVLVLDNLQWCDQESLAFLSFLTRLEPSAPLLIAMTLRAGAVLVQPELAEWVGQLRSAGLLTQIAVAPLEPGGTARLAEAIGGRPLTADERSLLQAATGGFPLHIVEAIRAMAGRGGDGLPGGGLGGPPGSSSGRDGGPGGPADDPEAPAGDYGGVLTRRMEMLGAPAQEVAGLAAAVGRDFSLNLLAEASDLTPDVVVQAVDELWRQRIVVERGDGYDFSHDLLRDAALGRVTPAKRWLLHRRLAQGLELLHGEDLMPVSAQLADQYARAGRPDKALSYYRTAAGAAAEVFAHSESIKLLTQALTIVRAQPPSRDAQRQELDLLEVIAAPLNARHGYASPQVQAVFERFIELATSLGREQSIVIGLVGLWSTYFVQGRMRECHESAGRALGLLHEDSDLRGPAHFAYGGALFSLGQLADAAEHFELGARLARGASLSIGTRPEIHGTAFLAHAHWLMGDHALARQTSRRAVTMARAIHHPYNLAMALAYSAITCQLTADPAGLTETIDELDELDELCARYDFAYYPQWSLVLRGWQQGGQQGMDLARRGIRNLQRTGALARMPYWLALAADLDEREGRPERARSLLDAAISGGTARGETWWLPEVQRRRARYDAPEQAVARLRAASALAGRHGSVSLIGRCRDDLAVLGVTT